jgi:hypothetical protein
MARVLVNVDWEEVETENGYPVDGYRVTCSRCGHYVDVCGSTQASMRRGAVMLKEECPRGESNFYELNVANA